MNDTDIIKYFNNFKLIKWKIINLEIQNYLINRYNDFYSIEKTDILKESYYRILNNIDVFPICPICGKKCKFTSNKYLKTCGSPKCLAKECQKRREETNFKKYGYISQFHNPDNYEKSKNTLIKKYGVDNPWKLKEIQDKCKNTVIQNNGGLGAASEKIKAKMKQTNLLRYGYEHNWQDPEEQKRSHSQEAKEKQKQTCLKKYGVEYTGQAEIKKKHTKESCLKHFGVEYAAQAESVKQKQYKTKKKNGTLNSSKLENESYDLLKIKYPDVIHHYKDNRYPFNCDFYIPSLDLFIECQYGQFHHGHPYLGTENDLKDIEILKENAKRRCEETGKDKSRYDNELETWTIRDVNKRNIVKQNNLNYIEFWNINELKKWLNNGKDIKKNNY